VFEAQHPLIAKLQSQALRHDIEVEGVSVCWRQCGAGPPLVLLHGGHGSWLHWVRNIEPLSQQRTLYIADMPGYGDSAAIESGDMQALLRITLASLNALLGAQQIIDLAGFSFGGLVAAQLAAARGHVRALCLFGAAGHRSTRRPRGKLVNWKQAYKDGDARTLAEQMRHNLAAHMLHDLASIDALAEQVHTASCVKTRFISKHVARAGGLAEALDPFQGPTLLAWGEHDITADPVPLLPTLCLGHAHRRGHIIQGAGHWVQYENAEAVNRLLLGS
jgi:2-hydroxy-6-oxonona-2,4-dienedioate hydrolase